MKTHAKNVGVLLLSASIAFLLMEGLSRLFFPDWAPRTARLTAFWKHDPRLGWSHVPGTAGKFSCFGLDSWVTINSRGFRGPLVPYERKPAEPANVAQAVKPGEPARRIVFLGDSFLWGYGVSDDETFASLLSKRVPGLEAVNLGVSGYSTDQELLVYQDEGFKYQGDYVVLFVSSNDLLGNTQKTMYVIYGKPTYVLESGELRLTNQPVPEPGFFKRTSAELAGRSYLLNAVHRLIESRRMGSGVPLDGASAPPAASAAPDGSAAPRGGEAPSAPRFPRTKDVELTLRLILELDKSVAEKQPGAHLLVVLDDDMSREAARQWIEYLKKRDVEAIAIGDVIDSKDQSMHLADGFHWTPAGHRVVTETLYTYLKSKGYLP